MSAKKPIGLGWMIAGALFVVYIMGASGDEEPTKPQQRQQKDTTYGSCTEAKAAGALPLNRGEDGYMPFLDKDLDGKACEPGEGE